MDHQIVSFKETNSVIISIDLYSSPQISRLSEYRFTIHVNSPTPKQIRLNAVPIKRDLCVCKRNLILIFHLRFWSWCLLNTNVSSTIEPNLFAQFIKMLLDTKWDTPIRYTSNLQKLLDVLRPSTYLWI